MAKTRETDETARIREMIADWLQALSGKQAARVMSHYGDEPVMFTLAPPLRTPNDDGGGLEAWFATWQGPLRYEMRDLEIMAGEVIAVCHSLVRMSGTKVDGAENDVWFRQTLGLRKIGGEWKIAHEHASVPFYMDGSMKAAVDLRP